MDKRALQFYVDTLKDKYSYGFTWMGRPVIQMPQDLIGIQEVIYKVQPDYVIETGIAHGGGLIFYASILEAMGHGEVIGIDIDIRKHNLEAIKEHQMNKRIRLYKGDSVSPELILKIEKRIGLNKKVVVILDSNHTYRHVFSEMNCYSPLVSVGSYLIVLDTIIEFLPSDSFPDRAWGRVDNPWTAVRDFLLINDSFEVDQEIEKKLLITSAPDGWLRRVR